jgi:S-adenosylmethionine hydrolase
VKLTSTRHRLSNVSTTFHGRDIFAPAAAYLSRGTPLASLGPPVRSIEKLELPRVAQSSHELRGEVIYVDGFGNLITNIDRDRVVQFDACFRDKSVSVRIKPGTTAIRIVDTYAALPKGAPLATFGSFGLLEVAIRDGNAATHFGAGPGSSVSVVGPK